MTPIRYQTRKGGFSLIELAIVLLIVALLLGGLLVPLNAQIDQQRAKETQKTLADLKEALIGFVIVNGRLPCPATPNSITGLENPIGGGNCSDFFDGLAPAATLGITPISSQGLLLDGWNNPIHYAVNDKIGTFNHALTTTDGIKTATINTLAGATLLVVCSNATGITPTNCGPAPTVKLTDNAPAFIYSLGKNGNTGTVGADETANANGNMVFVSHEQSSDGVGNEGFDDIANWIPSGILINRMVSAGKLP